MENNASLLFGQWKKQSLSRLDVSKKGSVDEDISHVVSLLNACENYFTTSSCSGRVIVIDGVPESTDVQKQNCVWLFVSHQKCQPEELVSSVSRASGDAVLKFEPFVLHVQCRRLQDAQLLHSVAINSGFRNSGLTVGKTGKIIMAVRSTHGLEVPLSLQGNVLVGQDYIHFLVQVANQKMEENLRRIQRFYQSLHAVLSVELRQELQIPDTRELQMTETENGDASEERKERSVYKRRRRRGQQQQKDEHCSPPELEDCMDLFT